MFRYFVKTLAYNLSSKVDNLAVQTVDQCRQNILLTTGSSYLCQLFAKPVKIQQCRTLCVKSQSQPKRNEDDKVQIYKTPRGTEHKFASVEESIKYMESEAYNITYGKRPVWYHYRPNHPGGRPRRITRKTCVRMGKISTGNPCPICRDEYLVADYRNIKLLKQFLQPGEKRVLKPARTQICMTQHKNILIAIEKARDVGLLENKWLAFREYDYSQYYPKEKLQKEDGSLIDGR